MSAARPVAGFVLALLLAFFLAGQAFMAAGASTQPQRLQVSSDGVHWGEQLDSPLFPATARWVPGDERTATVFVRTPSDVAGGVSLSVAALGGAETWIDFDVRVPGASWTSLASGGAATSLDVDRVATRDTVPVTVRARLVDDTNYTMRASSPFVLDINATELAERPGTRPGPQAGPSGDQPDGILPNTGNPVSLPLLWVGLAATALGSLLLLLARRRRDRREVRHV